MLFSEVDSAYVPSTENVSTLLYNAAKTVWPVGLPDWLNILIFHIGKEMSLHEMELPTDCSIATVGGESFSTFSFYLKIELIIIFQKTYTLGHILIVAPNIFSHKNVFLLSV